MMSRFQQEISGYLDEQVAKRNNEPNKGFWKKHAEKEMWQAVDKIKSMNIDENGVATWKSNGNHIPNDMLEKLEYAGVTCINYEATRKASKEADEKFFAEYRARKHSPSAEEIFEMQCAFGKGAVVVDAITGQRIQLQRGDANDEDYQCN